MAPKSTKGSCQVQAPDCLIWELVRNNHAFLKKSGSKTFSLENYNLLGKHTPKLTGFSNKCVMDVRLSSGGSVITHETLNPKNTRRVYNKTQVKKYSKCLKNLSELRTTVRKLRPDLAKHAIIKFAKLTRAKTDEKVE